MFTARKIQCVRRFVLSWQSQPNTHRTLRFSLSHKQKFSSIPSSCASLPSPHAILLVFHILRHFQLQYKMVQRLETFVPIPFFVCFDCLYFFFLVSSVPIRFCFLIKQLQKSLYYDPHILKKNKKQKSVVLYFSLRKAFEKFFETDVWKILDQKLLCCLILSTKSSFPLKVQLF